jgi:cytochrome c556
MRRLLILALIAPLALPAVAVGAGPSGAAAAQQRHEHMKALGGAAKALGEQLHSGAPDAAKVREAADKIGAAGRDIHTWFPAGSGQSAWPKSLALPAIWTDPAGFAQARQAFEQASAKLDAAAQKNDMAGVGAAAKPLFDSCKGCHTKFKQKDPD